MFSRGRGPLDLDKVAADKLMRAPPRPRPRRPQRLKEAQMENVRTGHADGREAVSLNSPRGAAALPASADSNCKTGALLVIDGALAM